MAENTLFSGESKSVEYKITVPEKRLYVVLSCLCCMLGVLCGKKLSTFIR